MDHPTGLVAFQHLAKGDPRSNDNFMFILGRQQGEFLMPRHRHNFDQIRLGVTGDMNLGDNFTLREGEIGYFGEGMPYGPQHDVGHRLQLVLQFGGASGYGFMSIEQRREAWKELEKTGRFEGPNYRHADGRLEWGLNAIWRQIFGVELRYPKPRYRKPVIVTPKSFNWLPVSGQSGVERKYLGAFSERGVWVEQIRIHKNSTWTLSSPVRQLLTVLNGTGAAAGKKLSKMSVIQLEPQETIEITAEEEMTFFVIGLPPVVTPVEESREYDLEEMPAQEVA
ncbi:MULTISPECIES: hypothetical protein [unclassified Beijerinckia]|uniref:hypothetical protein n=1 Tax=unclassified Beijerinckia TaxID=2638183 RepID=UPI000B844AAB|nr:MULTISPECIES: hypothetical protein [unclassified Beijerinckia]